MLNIRGETVSHAVLSKNFIFKMVRYFFYVCISKIEETSNLEIVGE